jgi:hypothetical protein
MGVWGTGLLENDSASDFAEKLVHDLCEFIENQLNKSADDKVLERPTLAAVACLRVLVEGIFQPGAVSQLISAERATAWKDSYLRWFDANASEFGASDVTIAGLRGTAVEEFCRLIECVS